MEYKLNNNEGFLITKSGESVDVLDSLNTGAEVIAESLTGFSESEEVTAEALVKISQRLNIVHYEAIDLGLPSGRKWADRNVGAISPEDTGLYFTWGSTEGFTKDSGRYCDGTHNGERDWTGPYSKEHGSEIGDNTNIPSVSEYFDAARKNMGAPWRMPTYADMGELLNSTYTTWTWTQRNGMNGYLVVSKVNGNSIFLPAAGYFNGTFGSLGSAGYYWESTCYDDTGGCCLMGYNGGEPESDGYGRFCGLPVRAVQ